MNSRLFRWVDSTFTFPFLFVRYSYNHANPVETGTPYEIIPGSVAANQTAWNCVGSDCPSTAGSFDLRRFNVSYWQNYERLVRSLQDMNIIADVIVFHP